MPKHRSQRVEKVDLVKELDFLSPEKRLDKALDEIVETVYGEEIHRVKITSLIDAYMKVTGKYSGQEYLFERAGSVQDVDQTDVEWLLSKRQGGRQCCGGTETGNQVFALY